LPNAPLSGKRLFGLIMLLELKLIEALYFKNSKIIF
jgi:hypothetical protein